MENLNKNANKTNEVVDVTTERMEGIAKKYQAAVKSIKDDGKVYIVEFNNGYTFLGRKSQKARSVQEIGATARWATEENAGKTLEDWKKEFKDNKIYMPEDGSMPEYVDTIEKVKAQKAIADKKAKEAEKSNKESK